MFIFPLLVQEWGELWPVPAELSLCRARVQLRVPGCLRGQGAAGPACPAGPVQAAAAFALNFPVSMA